MTITTLHPSQVAAGHDTFLLTADGSGIPGGAHLTFAGTSLVTDAVAPDGSQITSTVPAALVATAGSFGVQVVNAGDSEPAEPVIIIVK